MNTPPPPPPKRPATPVGPPRPPSPRAEATFVSALDCAPDTRDAFVAEACAGDDALNAEVRALLALHKGAGDFLEEPTLPPEVEGELSRLKPEEGGEMIGPYKLREQIGEGGFGTVWVADQEQPVRRRVALKIIKMGMDTKEVIARFGQERQALAMMDHPNIAKVLDAGATQHGRPFFVMELVRGMKITDYCDEKQLSTQERIELFITVCQAVQHAHQKGIIHRDLKPSNILVTVNDGKAVPKVIDFGVAKATQGRLTDQTIYTQFQQMIGTPLYMSPEQAELTSLDIDTRSDIYALGVLLYELLTGHTPIDQDTLARVGMDEIRRLIREVDPPRPSARVKTLNGAEMTTVAKRRNTDPAKLPGALRGDIDWIVMKCIEKDRARRYDTANGLAMDLQRHLANEVVIARPPTTGYLLGKLIRRNKLAFAAGAAIAAALVIGIATATWMFYRESDARKQTAAERDAKELARKDAEAISRFLREVLRSPDPTRDAHTITVAEILNTATKKLEANLSIQPAQRAKLQATLGSTYRALGLYREAILLQEKVWDYCRTTSGPEHPDTLVAISDLANSYSDAGRFGEALKLREKVLTLRRKISAPQHPDTITAMSYLAVSYANAGRWEEALALHQDVLAIRGKLLGPEHPDTLTTMAELAYLYERVGRINDALKLNEEVLPLSRKVLGSEHPATLQAMKDLATVYFQLGQRDRALKLREEVLMLYRKAVGSEHPATLTAMEGMAISYADAGRRDEAFKLHEEVLALRQKVLGSEHPDTLWAMNELASAYFNSGRRDEALKRREELLMLYRNSLGPEHPATLTAINNLAASYYDAGRRNEALKMQEGVLTLRRKLLGPEHPSTLTALQQLAGFYLDSGRHDEALPMLKEVLALRQKVLGLEHPDTLWAMNELAGASFSVGHQDEALKIREEVLPLFRKVNGPEHPFTLSAMTNLAVSYGKAGRLSEAVTLQEQSLAIKRRVLPPNDPALSAALNHMVELYEKTDRKDEATKLRAELEAPQAKK